MGRWILGVVAIIWSIDCVVAFYLTLPNARANFFARWRTAWKIKRGAGFYRVYFDLHRAGGLWLWIMLFVFAWSSVMMNMRTIYEPVMQALFDYRPYAAQRDVGPATPRLNWKDADSRGRQLLAELASFNGFVVGQPLSLMYIPTSNLYLFEARGSRALFERSPQGGGTTVTFDADTGALMELFQPTGQHAGNTIESWLYALHMARIFGIPYRIFVCVLGLALVTLSATGVYIWWKKRSAQNWRRQKGGALERA
jgi:uncharacterized iron-regulated membrane protein